MYKCIYKYIHTYLLYIKGENSSASYNSLVLIQQCRRDRGPQRGKVLQRRQRAIEGTEDCTVEVFGT
jgi:hypothetical protein